MPDELIVFDLLDWPEFVARLGATQYLEGPDCVKIPIAPIETSDCNFPIGPTARLLQNPDWPFWLIPIARLPILDWPDRHASRFARPTPPAWPD